MNSGLKVNMRGLRQTLHRKRVVTAALLTFPDPGVATVLGWSGYDFVFLDAEHGPFTLDTLRPCLEALESSPAASVARVCSANLATIKQVLDLGPHGIQVPCVATARTAARIVSACRYPPQGKRGIGVGRASRYGLALADDRATANDEIAVIAMIETAKGVKNADAITRTAGLDAIFVGPNDLAADMGHEVASGSVQDAIARVVTAANVAGTPVGTNVRPEDVHGLSRQGMSLFLLFSDYAGLAEAAKTAYVTATNQATGE